MQRRALGLSCLGIRAKDITIHLMNSKEQRQSKDS